MKVSASSFDEGKEEGYDDGRRRGSTRCVDGADSQSAERWGRSECDGSAATEELLKKKKKKDPTKLLQRLVDYFYGIFESDAMQVFFDKHLKKFDQSQEDFVTGAGHTLEQYEVYTEYRVLVEKAIDKFAVNEGFSSALECFEKIQGRVAF